MWVKLRPRVGGAGLSEQYGMWVAEASLSRYTKLSQAEKGTVPPSPEIAEGLLLARK